MKCDADLPMLFVPDIKYSLDPSSLVFSRFGNYYPGPKLKTVMDICGRPFSCSTYLFVLLTWVSFSTTVIVITPHITSYNTEEQKGYAIES